MTDNLLARFARLLSLGISAEGFNRLEVAHTHCLEIPTHKWGTLTFPQTLLREMSWSSFNTGIFISSTFGATLEQIQQYE